MKTNKIKKEFDALFDSFTPEEEFENQAQILAMRFLSLVDEAMAYKKISKKELAEQVGTSPAFITQLFRGDRKPNWVMLAKMATVLDLDFVISTKEKQEELIAEEIKDYHRKWTKSHVYVSQKGMETLMGSILAVVEDETYDYALAG